jgi:hypothetical protein
MALTARDGEDHIGPGRHQVLSEGIAVRFDGEVAGKEPRAAVTVPTQDGHCGAGLGVVVVDPGSEAHHELGHGGDIQGAEGADHAADAGGCRGIAREKTGLIHGEGQAEDIGKLGGGATGDPGAAILRETIGKGMVNDGEVGGGVGLGGTGRVDPELVTHGEDQVEAPVEEELNIDRVIGRLSGFPVPAHDPEFTDGPLQARQGTGVEGLILDPAEVGHQPDPDGVTLLMTVPATAQHQEQGPG